MRRIGILVAVWLAVVGLAAVAQAAIYYTATTGNNSNPGTLASPFQTIAKGISVLTPGDTLYLRAGTYTENISWLSYTIPSGTSWSSPITIGGYPGDARPTLQGYIDINLAGTNKYLMFRDFNIFSPNAGNEGIYLNTNYIRTLNMEIQYNAAQTACSNGLSTWGSHQEHTNLVIHPHTNPNNCRSHGIYNLGAFNVYDGIDSYNNGGYGLQSENDSDNTLAHDNIVRNSRFHSNGGSSNPGGVTMNQGDNNLIYNNLIYGNVSGANGIDINYSTVGTKIYNNTIYGNAGSGIGLLGQGGRGVHDVVIINNILSNNNGTISDQAANTTFQTNLCQTSGTGCILVGNPLFVNAASADFHLTTGSPAINAGVNLFSVVPTDFDAVARPTSAAFELGAFEFGGAGPPAPTRVRVTAQPKDTIEGRLVPEVVVQIEDGSGTLITTSSAVVTLALGVNPSGSTLGGTLTRAASSGRAIFPDLSLPLAGQGYTLTAASTGLTGDTSQAFRVWGREWSAAGTGSMICADVAGDSNLSSIGAGAPYLHSLTCPVPAGALRQGTLVRVCTLLSLHTGSAAGNMTVGLWANGVPLVSQNVYPTPPTNVTAFASWTCFVVVGTAAPGPSVPTYSAYEQFPTGIQYTSEANIIGQQLPLVTTAAQILRVVSQWGSSGSGDNTVLQLALFAEVPR